MTTQEQQKIVDVVMHRMALRHGSSQRRDFEVACLTLDVLLAGNQGATSGIASPAASSALENASSSGQGEAAWLIEGDAHDLGPSSLRGGPCYWAGGTPSYESFTSDHLQAVRFARKVDADRVIEQLLSVFADAKNTTFLRSPLKAVEHMWLASSSGQGWQAIDSIPNRITRAILFWPAFELDDEGNLSSKRLPENDVVAMGYRAGGSQWEGGEEVESLWTSTDDGWELGEPTHWMPLPDPPSSGQGHQDDGRQGAAQEWRSSRRIRSPRQSSR